MNIPRQRKAMEDVDQIRQSCVVENMVVFVDSSLRDRRANPTAAEYVVNFQQPFTNVMGVEVLDAAIPRTMYVVDAHNNLLRLISDGKAWDLRIPPGDIGMNELVVQLKTLFAPHGIVVTSQSVDVKTTSLLRFSGNRPFQLDMDASTAREVLGFDEYARSPAHAGLYLDRSTPPGGGRMYGSVRADDPLAAMVVEFEEDSTSALASLSSLGGRTLDLEIMRRLGDGADLSREYRVDFVALPVFHLGEGPTPDVASLMREATASVDFPGSGRPPSHAVRVESVYAFRARMRARGFPEIDHPAVLVGEDGVSEEPVAYIVVEQQDGEDPEGRMRALRLPTSVFITLAVPPDATREEGLRVLLRGAHAPSAVMLTPFAHSVHAPGIVSLVGERYVILRCKEIDENAQIGYAYMSTSPGLALFKLGVMGYSDIRLDFSSIRYKEFHPIGKLSRLTLRFETLAGRPYDFKGVNHHMLLVVKYYVPRMDPRAHRPLLAPDRGDAAGSVLNPSYDPDVRRYWCDNEGFTDSDDDSVDGLSSDDEAEMMRT